MDVTVITNGRADWFQEIADASAHMARELHVASLEARELLPFEKMPATDGAGLFLHDEAARWNCDLPGLERFHADGGFILPVVEAGFDLRLHELPAFLEQ